MKKIGKEVIEYASLIEIAQQMGMEVKISDEEDRYYLKYKDCKTPYMAFRTRSDLVFYLSGCVDTSKAEGQNNHSSNISTAQMLDNCYELARDLGFTINTDELYYVSEGMGTLMSFTSIEGMHEYLKHHPKKDMELGDLANKKLAHMCNKDGSGMGAGSFQMTEIGEKIIDTAREITRIKKLAARKGYTLTVEDNKYKLQDNSIYSVYGFTYDSLDGVETFLNCQPDAVQITHRDWDKLNKLADRKGYSLRSSGSEFVLNLEPPRPGPFSLHMSSPAKVEAYLCECPDYIT